MLYRIDLELLKGYSILLIIFYHYEVKCFKYGFIGVIVFINISGYLSLSVNKNRLIFSICKRLTRLTPSYYILIIVTVAHMLFFNIINENDVEDFKYLLLYIYNVRLIFNDDDYFYKENKSLLNHLWYISVIFQLYVIDKIIIAFKYNYILYVYLIILSFIYNCYSEYFDIKKSYYYNTFLRAWYYFLPIINNFISINLHIAIIITILLSMFKYKNEFFNTIIISLTSTSVCLGNKTTINNFIVNRIVIYLGKITYSLYLYHFIYTYYDINIFCKFSATLFSSILNNYIIENKLKKNINLLLIVIISLAFLLSNKVYYTLEKKRKDENIVIVKNAIKYSSQLWCSHCHYNNEHPIPYNSILLIGDSHLEHWIPAMLHYTKIHGIMIHYFYYHLLYNDYKILYNNYFHKKKSKWLLIILGFYTSKIYNNKKISGYVNNIINYLEIFTNNILFIEDTPKLVRNNLCLRCYELHIQNCFTIIGINVTVYPKIVIKNKRTKYVSFNNIICNKTICPCISNKISVYDTMSHLSPLYTRQFNYYFDKIFDALLNNSIHKIENKSLCNFYVHGKYYYRRC